METKSKFTEEGAVASLRKKSDIKIDTMRGILYILKNNSENKDGDIIPNPLKRNDLGNGSWGKIGFLQKKGYFIERVPDFNDKRTRRL